MLFSILYLKCFNIEKWKMHKGWKSFKNWPFHINNEDSIINIQWQLINVFKNVSSASKNSKTFWRKLYFRTRRQPSCLNNGLHDTPQSPGKVTTGWEKSLQPLSDFLATVILKLDHININRWKNPSQIKPHGLWFMILFLIAHNNILNVAISYYIFLVFVHTHEKCMLYIVVYVI